MSERPQTKFSTEMEWPIDVEWTDKRPEGIPLVGRTAYEDMPKFLKRCGSMLSNGMRLYNDHDHMETSCAELDDLTDLLASELATELLVHEIMQNAQKDGRVNEYKIQRRVIDSRGTTWGYHENYLALRRAIGALNSENMGLLLMYLAVRNLFVGAGCWVDGEFKLAQKASQVFEDIHESTTIKATKPLLNSRDKPYASGEYRRLHITSCDPNISPWATKVKVGSTALVIRMLQDGQQAGELQPWPGTVHSLARQVATDLTFSQPFQLKNGTEMLPIEIMQKFIQQMEKFISHNPANKDEVWTVQQLKRAYHDFTENPKAMMNYMDWPLRKVLIERQLAKASMGEVRLEEKEELQAALTPTLDKVAQDTDLAYDYSNPDPKVHTLTKTYRQRLWKNDMPPDAHVKERLEHPPAGRAKLRGDRIKYAKKDELTYASWDEIRYYEYGRVKEERYLDPLVA